MWGRESAGGAMGSVGNCSPVSSSRRNFSWGKGDSDISANFYEKVFFLYHSKEKKRASHHSSCYMARKGTPFSSATYSRGEDQSTGQAAGTDTHSYNSEGVNFVPFGTDSKNVSSNKHLLSVRGGQLWSFEHHAPNKLFKRCCHASNVSLAQGQLENVLESKHRKTAPWASAIHLVQSHPAVDHGTHLLLYCVKRSYSGLRICLLDG